jgi:hypothetical protein
LKSIIIPGSAEVFGERAFPEGKLLASVIFGAKANLQKVHRTAFWLCACAGRVKLPLLLPAEAQLEAEAEKDNQ